MSSTDRSRKNVRIAVACAAVFAGMVGAAFAAVPAYKAFCQLTGFDGTVRRAEKAPDKVLDRTIKIRFDANVRDLPWTFSADQNSQTVKVGATNLAFFRVTNTGDKPVTGRAIYSVVPEQAGPYFQKLECFCFSDQTLQPGQTAEFPVVYFVDPQFAKDFETKDKPEIVLSYTFFKSKDQKQASASAPPKAG